MSMYTNIDWTEIIPLMDQLTLATLKMQQMKMKMVTPPDELYNEIGSLKDELTEKLVEMNAIKFKNITEK